MNWELIFQAIIAITALLAVLGSGIAGIIWLIRTFLKPIEDQLKELKAGQDKLINWLISNKMDESKK